MNNKSEYGLPVNEQIKAARIQVIDQQGENKGVITREEALKLARSAELDLVMVAEKDGVPIAKIVDYGKILYAKKKKQAEAKKHQKVIQIKEIKLRPKIGEHDYQIKMKQMSQFLQEGKHVKVTLVFKGREVALGKETSTEMFNRILQTLHDDYGLENVTQEKEAKAGSLWSRIYTKK